MDKWINIELNFIKGKEMLFKTNKTPNKIVFNQSIDG